MERRSHFKLEHRKERLISRGDFAIRMGLYLGSAALLILIVLAIAMIGYHTLEGLSWLDSFLNAAMILGGMGPVSELHTEAGKFFAGSYAVFCGLFFVIIAGLIFAPILHRVLHHFHFDEEDGDAR